MFFTELKLHGLGCFIERSQVIKTFTFSTNQWSRAMRCKNNPMRIFTEMWIGFVPHINVNSFNWDTETRKSL
jgi:hypothetical protein